MSNRKLQIIVGLTVPDNYSDRQACAYVRDWVQCGSHGSGGDHPLQDLSGKATAKLFKPAEYANTGELMDSYQSLSTDFCALRAECDALKLAALQTTETPTYAPGYEDLKARYALMAEQYDLLKQAYAHDVTNAVDSPIKNTVQTVNAIIHAINSLDLSPPPMTWSKGEHYKKGGRAVLAAVNTAIRQAGMVLLEHAPLATDGEMFNYWVQEASNRPMRLAQALSECTSPAAYRLALHNLQDEDKAAIADGKSLNSQGGLKS